MYFVFKILENLSFNKKKSYKFLTPIYGALYKLKSEALPFRYVYRKGDKEKGAYRFKHHNLKEYVFYNLSEIERAADKKEIKLYNLIKEHVNDVARKK